MIDDDEPYNDNTNPDTAIFRKGGKQPGGGTTLGSVKAPHLDAPAKAATIKSIVLMQNAKAKKEMYNANLAELEYQTKRGELARLETFIRALETASTAAREHILNIPARWASVWASQSDPRILEQELDRELRYALSQLADAIELRIPRGGSGVLRDAREPGAVPAAGTDLNG